MANLGTKFKETDIGLIPEEWTSERLARISDIQTGPFGSQLHEKDYVERGTPIITVEHLLNDRIDHDGVIPQVSEEDRVRLSRKYALREGDIVFSRVGSVDRSAYVSKSEDGWLFSGRLLRVRPNSATIDSRWLDCWLRQEVIKEYVRNIAVGATMPSINTSLLGEIPVFIPELYEQKQIAEILSSLDDKIELNRKINANLEKLASSLFKKWFVDIGDELPEGWRMGKLSDLIDNISDRYIGTNEDDNFPYVPIDMISSKSLSLSSVAKSIDAKSSLIKFKKDDILFGAMRSYFHKVSLAPFEGLTRTTCFILRPRNKNILAFCTLLIFQEETINFASSHAEGSTIPYAKWNNSLEDMPVRIPPNEILEKFNETVYPLLEKIRDSYFENNFLITIRDSLLPRLMSGKIRVPIH